MHQPQLNPVPPRIGNGVRVLQELHPPRNWYRNCDMYIYIYIYSVYIYIYILQYTHNSTTHEFFHLSRWNDGMMESSIPILFLPRSSDSSTGSLRTWSAPKCWSVLRRLRGSILRGWNHDWDHGMGMFNRRWKYNPWKNLGFSPSSRIQPKLVWVEPLVKGYVATSGITRDMQTLVLYWLFRQNGNQGRPST